MAEAWIKMRTNLATNPKIVAMSVDMGVHVSSVIGACFVLWAIGDEHSTNGRLDGYTFDTIDAMVGIKGFSKSAASDRVKWLEQDERGVVIPRFGTHNGNSAKRRAAKAKSENKRRTNRGHRVDTRVQEKSENCPPTTDKRREEKEQQQQQQHAPEKSRTDIDPSLQPAGVAAAGDPVVVFQAKVKYLLRRPDWLPNDKPWLDEDGARSIAGIANLTQSQVDAVLNHARKSRATLDNPAGYVMAKLRKLIASGDEQPRGGVA